MQFTFHPWNDWPTQTKVQLHRAHFGLGAVYEALDQPGAYKDKIVRFGETSPDAMRDKARHVLSVMEARMEALGVGWAAATTTQAYTVRDLYPFFAEEIVRRGAAKAGLTWYYARPPVEGLEYEMDLRGVPVERVF